MLSPATNKILRCITDKYDFSSLIFCVRGTGCGNFIRRRVVFSEKVLAATGFFPGQWDTAAANVRLVSPFASTLPTMVPGERTMAGRAGFHARGRASRSNPAPGRTFWTED